MLEIGAENGCLKFAFAMEDEGEVAFRCGRPAVVDPLRSLVLRLMIRISCHDALVTDHVFSSRGECYIKKMRK